MSIQELDPQAEAERVLSTCWPARVIPVDPVAIARQLGVDVRQATLPDNVSAAIVKKPGADAVILLAQSDSNKRKRFSCAHELGHYVRRAGEDSIEFVDLRGPVASEGLDAEEIFANRFAACLLMPEKEVRDFCDAYRKQTGNPVPPWFAAEHFGVSGEAMGFRLANLRIEHERN